MEPELGVGKTAFALLKLGFAVWIGYDFYNVFRSDVIQSEIKQFGSDVKHKIFGYGGVGEVSAGEEQVEK